MKTYSTPMMRPRIRKSFSIFQFFRFATKRIIHRTISVMIEAEIARTKVLLFKDKPFEEKIQQRKNIFNKDSAKNNISNL